MDNKLTEGVGKRIVDALKQQSDIEIQQVVESPIEDKNENIQSSFDNQFDNSFENSFENSFDNGFDNKFEPEPVQTNVMKFEQTYNDVIDDLDIPTNVAVLRQLISQLPAGVSKQTGAQIIKQTMEALGISMKSVLQEAQQVQENLNRSTRECQASIVEYRKQIGVLERQSQKLQRQYASLNDIISLFVQTNL